MRLFWLGIAWLSGIALGQLSGLPAGYFALGVGLGATAYLLNRPEKVSAPDLPQPRAGPFTTLAARLPLPSVRSAGLIVTVGSLGALRLALAAPSIDQRHIASYNDLHQPLVVTGLIVDYPDVRDSHIALRLEAEQLELSASGEQQAVEGLLLVEADRYGDYRFGDRLQVTGYLETPPEDEEFSFRDYLARQSVFSMMARASVVRLDRDQGNPLMQMVYALRTRAFETIHQLFPDPEASLLAGILLGLESGISREVREAFNATSTTHIIAISGFNLTVLAALVIRLFGRWLGIRRGAVAAAATIGLYTLLVGADAAVVRAAIMGGLALFARFLGRRAHGLASLSAAAVLMTAIQPRVLWDVGFQLSFAATLGLVLYADPLQAWFVRVADRWMPTRRAERLAQPVGEYLLFTLAAQATTLPLTIAYFQRLSISSLLANPVILPAQPPLMILGGMAAIAGMIALPFGRLLALIAWPFPAFTIRAVTAFAAIRSASLDLAPVAPLTVFLLYALLFGATWLAGRPPELRPSIPRPSAAAVVFGLLILTGVTWRELATRPDGKTHLTVFDGGSRLVESADGRFVLIGGGSSAVQLSQQLGRRLPLLHRQIDWLVITDTREPQVRGLIDLTDRYRIGAALIPSFTGGTAFQSILSELQAAGVEIVPAERGRRLRLGTDSYLELIDRDEIRISLMLSDNRAHIALLADSEPLEADQPPWLARPTALIVHGPGSSEWLASLRPWLSIATGYARDPVAWPLRTEHHGWIELVSDGRQLWVQSQFPASAQTELIAAP